MPPMASSTRSGGLDSVVVTAWSADQLVAGLGHRGLHLRLAELALAGHGDRAAVEHDRDVGDAVQLGDLLGDRADAVAAGHPGNGVGGGDGHAWSSRWCGTE